MFSKRGISQFSAIFFSLAVFLSSCGPKAIKRESALDTPVSHYRQGLSYLEIENYESAMREFLRSKSLDPRYAPAYEGLALSYLGLGNFEEAEKYAEQSKKMDKNYSLAWVASGRVYLAQKKYNKAVDEFEKAIKKDRLNIQAYLYMGRTYAHMQEYDRAKKTLEKILEIDPTNMEADRELEELSRLSRATAGMPPEYVEIAKSSAITRAEAAAIFVNELPLDRIFRRPPSEKSVEFRPPEPVMGEMERESEKGIKLVDVPETHWARAYVEKVVGLGIMDLFPDGSFRPEDKITKLNFAVFIQNFLVKAFSEPGLETKYIGTVSPFADVPGFHFAFNAVMVNVSRGLLKGKADGTFGVKDNVSGTDAILIMKKLKSQF